MTCTHFCRYFWQMALQLHYPGSLKWYFGICIASLVNTMQIISNLPRYTETNGNLWLMQGRAEEGGGHRVMSPLSDISDILCGPNMLTENTKLSKFIITQTRELTRKFSQKYGKEYPRQSRWCNLPCVENLLTVHCCNWLLDQSYAWIGCSPLRFSSSKTDE